jgi:hypothetical protein
MKAVAQLTQMTKSAMWGFIIAARTVVDCALKDMHSTKATEAQQASDLRSGLFEQVLDTVSDMESVHAAVCTRCCSSSSVRNSRTELTL